VVSPNTIWHRLGAGTETDYGRLTPQVGNLFICELLDLRVLVCTVMVSPVCSNSLNSYTLRTMTVRRLTALQILTGTGWLLITVEIGDGQIYNSNSHLLPKSHRSQRPKS